MFAIRMFFLKMLSSKLPKQHETHSTYFGIFKIIITISSDKEKMICLIHLYMILIYIYIYIFLIIDDGKLKFLILYVHFPNGHNI